MKKPMTWNSLKDLVAANNLLARPIDRHFRMAEFGFDGTDNSLVPLADARTQEAVDMGMLAVLPHAFKQFGQRFGFPADYVAALPPNMKTALVNWHIHQEEGRYKKPLMFRTIMKNKQRSVRSLMSDKFQPFDDMDLIEELDNAFFRQDVKDIMVREVDLDDLTTHIRLTFGEPVNLTRGQVFKGLHLSNSEVGMRNVVIRATIYVVRCSNGMMSKEDMATIRHTGRVESLRGHVKDAVRLALGDTDRLSALFAGSINDRIDKPINFLTEALKGEGLTRNQINMALNAFSADPGNTRWDVVNAVTAGARQMPTFEGRYQMELAGAAILDPR